VRAFNLDDGAYDEGVIWRNELRLRSRSLFGHLSKRLNDRVSPYFFADFASAYQMGPTPCGQVLVGGVPEYVVCRPHQNLSGMGAGTDYSLGHFSATLTGAYALGHAVEQTANGPEVTTREGHLRLLARATLRF
jgi:hemolysin activation/secretion protein